MEVAERAADRFGTVVNALRPGTRPRVTISRVAPVTGVWLRDRRQKARYRSADTQGSLRPCVRCPPKSEPAFLQSETAVASRLERRRIVDGFSCHGCSCRDAECEIARMAGGNGRTGARARRRNNWPGGSGYPRSAAVTFAGTGRSGHSGCAFIQVRSGLQISPGSEDPTSRYSLAFRSGPAASARNLRSAHYTKQKKPVRGGTAEVAVSKCDFLCKRAGDRIDSRSAPGT
jgi:hypothetical protein